MRTPEDGFVREWAYQSYGVELYSARRDGVEVWLAYGLSGSTAQYPNWFSLADFGDPTREGHADKKVIATLKNVANAIKTDQLAQRRDPVARLYRSGAVDHVDPLYVVYYFFSLRWYFYRAAQDEHGRPNEDDDVLVRMGLSAVPVLDWIVDACFSELVSSTVLSGNELTLGFDIDHPLSRLDAGAVRRLVGDLVRRHDPGLAWLRLRSKVLPMSSVEKDPYWLPGRDWRDLTKYSAPIYFYYMACGQPSKFDSGYDISSNVLRDYVRRATVRSDCRIGIHPSYFSAVRSGGIAGETGVLRRVVEEEGYRNTVDRVRLHYLRLLEPSVLSELKRAGLSTDASIGFSKRIGFRAGTGRPFPIFCAERRKDSGIVEVPFIAMDTVLLRRGEGGDAVHEAEFLEVCRVARSTTRRANDGRGATAEVVFHPSNMVWPVVKRVFSALIRGPRP